MRTEEDWSPSMAWTGHSAIMSADRPTGQFISSQQPQQWINKQEKFFETLPRLWWKYTTFHHSCQHHYAIFHWRNISANTLEWLWKHFHYISPARWRSSQTDTVLPLQVMYTAGAGRQWRVIIYVWKKSQTPHRPSADCHLIQAAHIVCQRMFRTIPWKFRWHAIVRILGKRNNHNHWIVNACNIEVISEESASVTIKNIICCCTNGVTHNLLHGRNLFE